MRYFLLALAIFSLVPGCGSPEAPKAEGPLENGVSQAKALPVVVRLQPQARQVVEGWPEFAEFESRMGVLLQTQNQEELGIVLEELIENLSAFETAAIPIPFDRISVRSRKKLIKTYLLKTQAALHYRTDHQAPLAEAVTAYNGLLEHFNHIVSSNLDPSIFEDD